MIVISNKNITIKNPEDLVGVLSNEIGDIRYYYQNNETFKFVMPNKFVKNFDKTVYKAGFLSNFLKLLLPETKYDDICEIINNDYQIFVGRRQIERLSNKYNKNRKFYDNQ